MPDEALAQVVPADWRLPDDERQALALNYTSGTSGKPALHRHPAAQLAAVVARLHAHRGESPGAFVESRTGMDATEAKLIAVCQAAFPADRFLASVSQGFWHLGLQPPRHRSRKLLDESGPDRSKSITPEHRGTAIDPPNRSFVVAHVPRTAG